MKRIISLVLISVVLATLLCACAKAEPSGRYICEKNPEVYLEFGADTVVLHSSTGDETGTFTVGDELVITLFDMATGGEYDKKTETIVWSGETYIKQESTT